MSCGKTHTRRQVASHRRQHVVARHTAPHGKRIVIVRSLTTPKKKRVVIKKRITVKQQVRVYRFSLKALQAWERKHPFKGNTFCFSKLRYAAFTKAQMAQWFKSHPFKSNYKFSNKPYTAAQWAAWDKAHPFPASTVKVPKKNTAVKPQKPRKGLCLPLR